MIGLCPASQFAYGFMRFERNTTAQAVRLGGVCFVRRLFCFRLLGVLHAENKSRQCQGVGVHAFDEDGEPVAQAFAVQIEVGDRRRVVHFTEGNSG